VTLHCKDCVKEWDEGGPPPRPRVIVERSGGRCATHWRKVCKERKAKAHATRVEKVYGLQRGQYEILYEAQGGRCYICQVATGKTKRLAVDHDHKNGYVRGLLCSPCNRHLGHIRDSTLIARRIIWYLNNPPAWQAIGKVKPCE
jgi:recombination endonuclease VII